MTFNKKYNIAAPWRKLSTKNKMSLRCGGSLRQKIKRRRAMEEAFGKK
jgi:hypothetical protein